MQGYDIIMLGVVALTTIRGYTKGLAWQIASIASIAVSYFVAVRFRDQLAVHIEMPDPWRNLVSMVALFVASSLVIWFLFQNVKGGIEKAKLKDFDKQLGALFGAVKGAALCVILTLFAVSLLQPSTSQQIVNSRSGFYIAQLLDRSDSIIPPELHNKLEPYIRRAEDRFRNGTLGEEDPNAFPVELPEDLSLPQDDWFGGPNRSATVPDPEFSNREDARPWR